MGETEMVRRATLTDEVCEQHRRTLISLKLIEPESEEFSRVWPNDRPRARTTR
jgi:hypothetical protein